MIILDKPGSKYVTIVIRSKIAMIYIFNIDDILGLEYEGMAEQIRAINEGLTCI